MSFASCGENAALHDNMDRTASCNFAGDTGKSNFSVMSLPFPSYVARVDADRCMMVRQRCQHKDHNQAQI